MDSSTTADVAVITGGAGGIGAATAAILREDGWRVVIADLDLDRAQAEASRIGAFACAIDIADKRSVDEAAAWVEREIGPCGALVACAAHLENPHRPEDQDIAEFDRIVATNIRGTFVTLTVTPSPGAPCTRTSVDAPRACLCTLVSDSWTTR